MKIFKTLHVSIAFSTEILIISLASPYKCIFPKLSTFLLKFPLILKVLIKRLKNFQKIAKFPLKNFENFRV